MGIDTKIMPLQPEKATGEIPVFYTKSNFYRVIHVDGLYGGPAPTLGNIVMTVFSSRVPFPDQSANDASGKEIVQRRVAKPGIEQEVEASLVLNLQTAKSMHLWLDSVIKNTEASLLQQVQKK